MIIHVESYVFYVYAQSLILRKINLRTSGIVFEGPSPQETFLISAPNSNRKTSCV